jgi:hypothetical protein
VAGSCECGNDPLGSIKCGEFRDLAEDMLASQEGPQTSCTTQLYYLQNVRQQTFLTI